MEQIAKDMTIDYQTHDNKRNTSDEKHDNQVNKKRLTKKPSSQPESTGESSSSRTSSGHNGWTQCQ